MTKFFRAASEPRTVVLHRARKGFGFVLRGAKAASPLMELRPSERCPGLQYLDDVDAGGVADRAGLRKGDYLLAVRIYRFHFAREKFLRTSDDRTEKPAPFLKIVYT